MRTALGAESPSRIFHVMATNRERQISASSYNRLRTGSFGSFSYYLEPLIAERHPNFLTNSAGGGDRTRTSFSGPRIFIPLRLSPPASGTMRFAVWTVPSPCPKAS